MKIENCKLVPSKTEGLKIIVTGGAGFIGSHLVDALLEIGHKVVVVDNLSSGRRDYINPKAVFVEGDIVEPNVVDKIVNEHYPIDAIFHLAAQKSVTESVKDPIYDANINIIGGLRVFEAAKKHQIKKIIFSSTGGALYGDGVGLPTPEDAKIAPQSPYGIAKYSLENYLRFYKSSGIITQILRYSNVYGPRQDPLGEAGVVAIFCQKMIRGEDIIIFGDGKQTRDFVFASDVVEANSRTLNIQKSGVWNIGAGKETSVNKIAEVLLASAKHTKSKIVYQPARAGELKRSCLDNAKAKKELGWSPKVALSAGLEKTFQYYQSMAD